MELLIIRHGEAVGEAPGLGDAGRFLTEKGRKVTRKVARWLTKKPKRCPAAIWTSPLVRAVQTAEIVAEVAGVRSGVEAKAQLAPGTDPSDIVALLRAANPKGLLALVGHEPSLSMLATALIGDASFPGFKKSGVLGLSWDGEGKAEVRFVLDPKTMTAHESVEELRREQG